MKKNKGITLIALVITIIVLLILAGLTINMLVGENGILNQAKSAKEETEVSEIKERIGLAVIESRINDNLDGKIDVTKLEEGLTKLKESNVIDSFEAGAEGSGILFTVTKGNYTFEIAEDGNVTLQEASISVSGLIIKNGETTLDENSEKIELGTALTISFEASITDGTIESIEPSLPHTTDGTKTSESFTITGKSKDGKTITKTYIVDLEKYYKMPEVAIGDYIEYDVAYTDMYMSSNVYTTTNGWRLLSCTDNGDGTYSDVRLMSTGIPAKLYSYYNKGNNEWYVTDEDTGNTLEDFKKILQPEGTSYVFYTGNLTYYSLQAAAGLYYNFGDTIYRYGTSAGTNYNQGYFTSIINGTTTYDSNYADTINASDLFLTEKADNVRLLTLTEINTALNRTVTNEDGTTVIDVDNTSQISDSTGLYRLNKLTSVPGMSSFTTYTSSGHYWLASPYPYASSSKDLCFVSCSGSVYSSNYASGVRPSVSLKSDVKFEISEDGTYWTMVEVD